MFDRSAIDSRSMWYHYSIDIRSTLDRYSGKVLSDSIPVGSTPFVPIPIGSVLFGSTPRGSTSPASFPSGSGIFGPTPVSSIPGPIPFGSIRCDRWT